jgi:hypothetical protein
MVTGTEEKRDRYSELPKCAAYEKTHTQHLTISPCPLSLAFTHSSKHKAHSSQLIAHSS